MRQNITIIGAGLGGCFLAILFAKRGYTVDIYERLPEKDLSSEASKRSFALTMYGYGIDVLKKERLWDNVSSIFVRLEGSVTFTGRNTKPIIDRVGNLPFYTVSRSALLKKLLAFAKKYSSISFHFGKELIVVDCEEHTMTVQDIFSKEHSRISCDVIFGADGVHSRVRKLLQKQQQSIHAEEQLRWTYKQVFFSKELAQQLGLKGRFSQNRTGKHAIFVAYPNQDQSYSAMFLLPQNTLTGFSSLQTQEEIKQSIKKYFPQFIPAISEIADAFLHHPEGHFSTIRTSPWYYKNFMAILGDAPHAFPPFYGQGVSAAFADSMTLIHFVEKYGADWERIFPFYQEERKKNTDALADLSIATLARYQREKRADYAAIYAKLESLLHRFLPAIFHPPPFARVAADQPNAANYLKKHIQQRRMAKYLCVPLLVAAITGFVAVHEAIVKFSQKK